MNEPLTPNTKAILLLTAPLIVGRRTAGDRALRPLSLKREYNRLAKRLREIGRVPADLLDADAGPVLDECLSGSDPAVLRLDRGRLEALLGRGVQLSLAVEKWRTRAIWVVSRADGAYPGRLRRRLGAGAPPVLYGCGDDRSFLDDGGLAVVGPRAVGDNLLDYARRVGELAAEAGRTVVSGGARGVDRAAMGGALAAGGRAIGVLANDLARAATQRDNRKALLEGRLLLVSAYDPAARFLPGHAMERHHSVYSLADAALVVEALVDRGGTRAGATAQLARRSVSPVYVRSTLGDSEGLAELETRGALPWPNPQSPEEFAAALGQGLAEAMVPSGQRVLRVEPEPSTLAEPCRVGAAGQSDDSGEEWDAGKMRGPADVFWQTVRGAALRTCREATPLKAIASGFGSTVPQTKVWLDRLVAEGALHLEQRPARYAASEAPREGEVRREFCEAEFVTPGDELWCVTRKLLKRALDKPKSGEEVADELRIMPKQAQLWLKRLSEEGDLERRERPVRYVARSAGLLAGVGPLENGK